MTVPIKLDPDALTLADIATLEQLTGMGLVEVLEVLASGDVRKWTADLFIGCLVVSGMSLDDARKVKPVDLDFESLNVPDAAPVKAPKKKK